MTVLFINGSFGIGKTSTARSLKGLLAGRIYNPEIGGSLILSLPRWLRLTNQNSGDYQDMPLWRNMIVSANCARESVTTSRSMERLRSDPRLDRE